MGVVPFGAFLGLLHRLLSESSQLVVAQASDTGDGGLPTVVVLGLVVVISFLGFRWVFRHHSRHSRSRHQRDAEEPADGDDLGEGPAPD